MDTFIDDLTTIRQHDIFGKSRRVKSVHKHREKIAVVLELGAGGQSSMLGESIVTGDSPRVDLALFADTGNEPSWVYDQVKYLKSRLASVGIPLIEVKRPGLGILEAIYDEYCKFITIPLFTKNAAGIVGRLQRQCTSEFKIVPCDNYLKDWLIERGYGQRLILKDGSTRRIIDRGIYIECIYGISYDEWQRAGKRGPQWQKSAYPLIDQRLTRDDCLAWLADHNLPVPDKSSCKICPFHTDKHLLWVSKHHPIDFEEICVFDDWLRTPAARAKRKTFKFEFYTHWSCIPLRQVDLQGIADGKIAMPLYAQEMCGDHCRT